MRKNFCILFLICICLVSVFLSEGRSQDFTWRVAEDKVVQFLLGDEVVMESPKEGLWAFADDWKNDEPTNWKNVAVSKIEKIGNWTILYGQTKYKTGDLFFRDSFIIDQGMLKGIRRFEYKGKEPLTKMTLSIRWNVNGQNIQTFQPGTLYYGNPSGEKNRPDAVASWHGKPGEFAFFEEHRYPMPFACLEDAEGQKGAALYTIPSPIVRGNVQDQWWSLGARVLSKDKTELALYTGYIGYNGQKSVAKAIQARPMKYPESTMTIIPDTVIEKTFYLDTWKIRNQGTAFQRPIKKTLDLFKPYNIDNFPTRDAIIASKFTFAKKRWLEGDGYAGFSFFPDNMQQQIVMGWCGQAASPGYALQVLEPILLHQETDPAVWKKTRQWITSSVQKSLDFLTTTTFYDDGFSVEYVIKDKKWIKKYDHVSMGQAMYNFAKAIERARKGNQYNTTKWEEFLRKSCDLASKRILQKDWHPLSTAEGFYIAPLILASNLFNNETYRKAAICAAEHYAKRHLSMKEPYWGGTLDATCEDKEGAWAAFQGFLTLYEITGNRKYLGWAKHAGDVCLSYLVVWNIPLPPGRLADHAFKTMGWTSVSTQNQHLDVYGVLFAPEIWKLGKYLGLKSYQKVSEVMFRSCGQLIDPWGSQGEQIQETNFAQRGDMSDVLKLRGGYAESWTVFWITAHFLNSAARQIECNERQ